MEFFLSGLLGSLVVALISILHFRKQMVFNSNRYFLENLIKELQKIYKLQLRRLEIADDSIDELSSFQALCFKEFSCIEDDLEQLKTAIVSYCEGLKASASSTTTSSKEIQAQKLIETIITKIMEKIRKVT